jgi:xanthine phosphoribosyltransferase
MYFYTYEKFLQDISLFCSLIKDYKPDIILSIARGGVTFGHFVSEKLDIRDLYSINSIHYDDQKKLDTIKVFNIPKIEENKRVLILDDIVDSGETLEYILNLLKKRYPNTKFKTGSLFFKKTAIIEPDFTIHEAKEWIEFFWSKK